MSPRFHESLLDSIFDRQITHGASWAPFGPPGPIWAPRVPLRPSVGHFCLLHAISAPRVPWVPPLSPPWLQLCFLRAPFGPPGFWVGVSIMLYWSFPCSPLLAGSARSQSPPHFHPYPRSSICFRSDSSRLSGLSPHPHNLAAEKMARL